MRRVTIAELEAAGKIVCATCRYDLRGHAGDVRTCPECGRINDVRVIAEAFRLPFDAQHSRNWLILAAVPVWVIVVAGAMAGLEPAWREGAAELIPWCLASWLLCAWRFGARFQYRSGWTRVVAWHLIVAIQTSAALLAIMVVLHGTLIQPGHVPVWITVLFFACVSRRIRDWIIWPHRLANLTLRNLVVRSTRRAPDAGH